MTHDILNLADNLNEDFMKNKELIIQQKKCFIQDLRKEPQKVLFTRKIQKVHNVVFISI